MTPPFVTMDATTSVPYAAVVGFACFLYFVVYPVIVYFKDANGMLTVLSQLLNQG